MDSTEKLVKVRFKGSSTPYNTGEVASFSPKKAADLVRRDAAAFVDEPKRRRKKVRKPAEPAEPAASKSTGEGT